MRQQPRLVHRLMCALPGFAAFLGFCLVIIGWMILNGGYAETATNALSAENGANHAKTKTSSVPQVNSGTAFFVSHDGKTLTSAHVVRDCQEITIWIDNEEPRTGTILGVDSALDIALLASAGAAADIAHIDTTEAASVGEPVTTIGYGTRQHEPRLPEVTAGKIFGPAKLPSGGHALIVSASLKAGNSGGPVVDNTGSVVGLVIGRYTDRPQLTVAIPALDLRKFLARFGVSTGSDGRSPAGQGDVKSQLLHMSALVQCKPRRRGLSG